MSVTDGERMRVASEIRHIDAVRLDWTYGDDDVCRTLMLGYIAEAIGLHYAPYEFTSVEIRDRLADLIEPDTTADTTTPKCDRAALLALADELEGGFLLFGSTKSARQVFDFLSDKLGEYARRIREACGAAENLQ